MQNYPSATIGEYRMHGGDVLMRVKVLMPEELKRLQRKVERIITLDR
ncbi:hypothetical protein [Muribaculum gordoncarteri]|nr:hypothetical protein [Muribaculum gordoncarteri]